jgi:phosphoglycolate phosphatase
MRDPQSRRFRLVVFDWDGTLFDSTAIIGSAIQSACRDLGEAVPDDQAARFVIGLGLADAIRMVAPTLPADRHAEFAARYREHYLHREREIPLFGGVHQLLGELAEADYLLAIATGKSRFGLDRALERSGVAHHFHATRCADEGKPKPHPEMLLHLMDRLGAVPQETLMIGDTTHDLELARNAGAAALAVTYGAHRGDGLARSGPLAMVDSIDELRRWLRREG